MDLNNGSGTARVPRECTLPAAERPARAAEFGEVLTRAARGASRSGPSRLRLDLDPAPGLAGRIADLAAAETACCSFFSFTLTVAGGSLMLDVTVPAARAGVLDALAARIAEPPGGCRVSGLRSGQVARAAGVKQQTLRYYECRGLPAGPGRTLGGHRLYPAEAVTVLRVIKARSGSGSASMR